MQCPIAIAFILNTLSRAMPQSTGLDGPTKSKNNSTGDLIHTGVMIDKSIYTAFDETCKQRCMTKAAVFRALIADFAETGRLPGLD